MSMHATDCCINCTRESIFTGVYNNINAIDSAMYTEAMYTTIQNWKSNHKNMFVVWNVLFFRNWRKLFRVILFSVHFSNVEYDDIVSVSGLFFKHSSLAGLFRIFLHSLDKLADDPYVTYVRFMSQFFFIVYSITQNIQFVQCTVFLSFSPVYFVSVLFVAWKCTHENISYLTTLAFFSLSLSLNDYLLLSRFTNTIGWRKKTEKKNQQHRLNMQVRKVRAKTPIFTRHTATKRECNEQCKAQYTYNSQKGKKTTAHTVQLQELQFINIFYVRRSI